MQSFQRDQQKFNEAEDYSLIKQSKKWLGKKIMFLLLHCGKKVAP